MGSPSTQLIVGRLSSRVNRRRKQSRPRQARLSHSLSWRTPPPPPTAPPPPHHNRCIVHHADHQHIRHRHRGIGIKALGIEAQGQQGRRQQGIGIEALGIKARGNKASRHLPKTTARGTRLAANVYFRKKGCQLQRCSAETWSAQPLLEVRQQQ